MADHYTTEAIITALKQVNGMVYLAARVLDCSPNTIYARAKRTASVQDAIDHSRGELVDLAEQKFRSAILNGEPWAVAMALKTIGKNRGYTEKTQVDITSGDKPIDFTRLSDEQLQRLVKGDDPSRVLPD